MTPYYSEPGIDLYQGDNREVLAALGIRPEDVALLWGDPPYGIGEETDRRHRGHRFRGREIAGRQWTRIAGDDEPFDPKPWLVFQRIVLWGANHYAERLPSSSSWWVWDKTGGTEWIDNNSDAELAWVRIGAASVRIFSHLWKAFATASEKQGNGANIKRVHPTQKPEALASWGFQRAGLKAGDLVLSPWLGSGPEAAAAKRLGLRFIGIELDVDAKGNRLGYLDACVKRLRQGVLFAEGAAR